MRYGPPSLRSYQGALCPFCRKQMTRGGRRYPTREHLVAQALTRGRGLGEGPVAIVCHSCNVERGSIPLDAWAGLLRFRYDPRAVYVEQWMADNADLVEEARRLEQALSWAA